MEYAIGIIIQKTDTLAKLKLLFDKLRSLVETKGTDVHDSKFLFKEFPDSEIRFFVGIAKDVFPTTKKKLGDISNYDDGQFIPSISYMEFGEDYTYEEMKKRLNQFMSEQVNGKCWIADTNSELTGTLSTNFKSL